MSPSRSTTWPNSTVPSNRPRPGSAPSGLVAPDWTLYAVTANEVEFWQGDPDRRHVRLRYQQPLRLRVGQAVALAVTLGP